MFIKQASDGNWYVCRKMRAGIRRSGNVKASERDWFLVKYSGYSGYIHNSRTHISFPKEFVGKRVRLKVEVIE